MSFTDNYLQRPNNYTFDSNRSAFEELNPAGSTENMQNSKSPLAEDFNEKVSSPSHYTWLKAKCGIEVIDITRHMNFNLGNAIKYILRAGHKSEEGYSIKEKTLEDLKKADWYIKDEIKRIERHE